MASIFAQEKGSPSYKSLIGTPGSGYSVSRPSSKFGPGPGKVSVNPAEPETLSQSIEGLGQGILGIVGATPIVGGLSKGLLEFTGGIVGAGLGAVGSFKPVADGPSIGDVASGAVGAAFDALDFGRKEVAKTVFTNNVANELLTKKNMPGAFGLQGATQGIRDYYDIPEVRRLVDSGATVEELSNYLVKSGLEYGAKPDFVRDVAVGLLFDPVTWIPGGAIKGVASRAGALSKAVKAGEVLLAKDAQFLDKFLPLGKVYNAITGFTSGTSNAIARIIAGRTYSIMERGLGVKNVRAVVEGTAKVAGPEADNVISKLSDYAAIAHEQIFKAGASSLREAESVLEVQGNPEKFFAALKSKVTPYLDAAKVADNPNKVDAVVKDFLNDPDVKELFDLSTVATEAKDDLVDDIVKSLLNVRGAKKEAELLSDYESRLQRQSLRVTSREGAEKALALTGRLRTKAVELEATKGLIDATQDMIPLVNDVNAGRQFFSNALSSASGLSLQQAITVFDTTVLPLIKAGKLEDAVRRMEFVRSARYGQLISTLAQLRPELGKVAEIGNRVTLISARSLSTSRAKKIAQELIAAGNNPSAIKTIIDNAVQQYGDIYHNFGKVSVTVENAAQVRDEIVSFLKNNSEIFVQDITSKELGSLGKLGQSFAREAELAGYRLGVAPKDGVIGKWSLVENRYGQKFPTRHYAPFADPVNSVFRDTTGVGSNMLKYKRNPVQEVIRAAFDPRYGVISNQKVYNRYVIESSKIGLNPSESTSVYSAITELADAQQILPRGLSGDLYRKEGSLLEQTINTALGKDVIKRVAAGMGIPEQNVWKEVFYNVISANNGDLTDLGIPVKFTAGVKMRIPRVAAFTDGTFPQIRYGAVFSPQFRFGQENTEPIFFRLTSGAGVREARIADFPENRLRTQAIMGKNAIVTEIGDAQTAFMIGGEVAAQNILVKSSTFWDSLRGLLKKEKSISDVLTSAKNGLLAVDDRKRRGYEAIVTRDVALNAHRVVSSEFPEIIPKFSKMVDSADPYDVMTLLGVDFILRNDPVGAQALIKAGKTYGVTTLKTAEELAAYDEMIEAFKMVVDKESKRARKAIYFDPDRSFIERSLNHPVLALYPLSYMVGKVIPEFVRLMVNTPFFARLGGTRPFLGAQAYRQVSDRLYHASQNDDGLLKWIEDNPEAWMFINYFLPYTPNNFGFGFSAPIRKYVINPGTKGEMADIPGAMLESGYQLARNSFLGFPTLAGNTIKSVADTFSGNDQLTTDQDGGFDILQLLNNTYENLDVTQTKN